VKLYIVAYKDGVEIKVQAKKDERLVGLDNLGEKLSQVSAVDHIIKVGTDRVQADATVSQVQNIIRKVMNETGMKKSQFVIRTVKIRV
jgi:hypothetical protein